MAISEYGRLKIIKEYKPRMYVNPKGYIIKIKQVYCQCECGTNGIFQLSNLKSGHTKSCGCIHNKKYSKILPETTKNNKIYKIFSSIKSRCNNKNQKSYKNYGGRGIKCYWNSFEEFYKDMGDSYKEGLSIDRIDNNGNYSKENCRWATQKEQCNNKRNNRVIIFNGIKKNITEWADFLNIKRTTIQMRLDVYNWTLKKTLTT